MVCISKLFFQNEYNMHAQRWKNTSSSEDYIYIINALGEWLSKMN